MLRYDGWVERLVVRSGVHGGQSRHRRATGLQDFSPHVYIAIGYLWTATNYGYPHLNAVGGGIEKLPDWGHAFTYFGSVYYYPNANGTFVTSSTATPPNESFGVGYNFLKYKVGLAYAVFPGVAIEAGWNGENGANKNNFPVSYNANGAFAGLLFLAPF